MKAPDSTARPAPRGGPVYRSAAATPRRPRDLVFDRLPPAVRDRLTHGIVHGAPEPLLAASSGRTPLALRAALALAATATLGLCGLALWDLGDLFGKHAVEPASYAAGYGALFAVVAIAGAVAAHLRSFQRGAPFRSGRYLFALDLVEATGGRLRVTPLDTLRGAEARPGDVALRFEDGYEVAFPVDPHDDPAAVAGRVNSAVTAARALTYPADEVKLERIDPFFEVRVTEDWSSAADAGAGRKSRLAWFAVAAALSAAPVGLGLLRARNALSDDLMFEQAKTYRAGDQLSLKLAAYNKKGTRHLDQAAALLVNEAGDDKDVLRRYVANGGPMGALAADALFDLAKTDQDELSRYLRRGGPRADEADDALFAIARRLDTMSAYATYLEHGKRHAEEVRTELLPAADFKQASRSQLVGSLFSFVRRNPGSKFEDEAWQHIRALYDGAIPAFRAVEQPSPEGLHFSAAMLAALQDRADPRVAIEVMIMPSTAIADADVVLAARYGKRYLSPAARFSGVGLDILREDVHGAVAGWFGLAFPHGVAEVSHPTGDDDARPRFQIRLTPMVNGSNQWRRPATASSAKGPGGAAAAPSDEDIKYVTPVLGFFVQVMGVVPGRDGKDTKIAWDLIFEDTTDGKMQTTDFKGAKRSRRDMLEDAFSLFIESVPEHVTRSFHQKI
jgi:hypothetical protein